MQKQFVTYEIALKLKELGFDEPCLAFYDTHLNLQLGHKPEYLINNEKANYIIGNDKIKILLAPLYQQVIDWFREKHNIIITWNLHDGDNPNSWRITISRFDCYDLLYNQHVGREPYYKRYEEAREQAILKCIEICKNNL